jgi:hypothetical protein
LNLLEAEAYTQIDWTQDQNVLFQNSVLNSEEKQLQALMVCQNGIQKSKEWMKLQDQSYQITKQKIMVLLDLINAMLE